jgi:hypothetical protein
MNVSEAFFSFPATKQAYKIQESPIFERLRLDLERTEKLKEREDAH